MAAKSSFLRTRPTPTRGLHFASTQPSPDFSINDAKENIMDKKPRSYMTDEDRQGLSQNAVFLSEALAANEAGDEETGWQWLALAELPAYSLMSCKVNLGADFVREKRLNTAPADKEYGSGWLDAS
jgi:hypothetical protein